jgi:Protein of unknown function (DUF2589)
MPLRDLSTLGLGQLLGSLLSAVVEAQDQATRSSLGFVEDLAFIQDSDGTAAEERMRTVTLRYTKLNENQQPADFVLQIPLLALVSIPTLTIRQAKVAFTYDVTATEEREPVEAANPRPLSDLVLEPAVLRGIVRRPPPGSQRESASVDIEVTVESEPLPVGLERMVELTELTVSQPAPEEQ